MLAANDNFLYLKVPLKLMLWSHMPVCYYKFDITHESVFSSPSLLNEYLRYDKLWGPSQRVVSLLTLSQVLWIYEYSPLRQINQIIFGMGILAIHSKCVHFLALNWFKIDTLKMVRPLTESPQLLYTYNI